MHLKIMVMNIVPVVCNVDVHDQPGLVLVLLRLPQVDHVGQTARSQAYLTK